MTVGEAELRYGAAILPTGKRRQTLVTDIERMLRDAFEDRVLPFDREAARAYADIAAMRRSVGLHVPTADCQIAAIARSRDMAVANAQRRGLRQDGNRGRRSLDGSLSGFRIEVSSIVELVCRAARAWTTGPRCIRMEQINEGFDAMKAGEVIRSIIEFEA